MSKCQPEQRDVLQLLKTELRFVEQGGYGRSASTPWKWSSTFQHSPTCVNYNHPQRTHPCTECALIDFVPAEARSHDVPCHEIAIGPAGETVSTMERERNVLELEAALRNWLQAQIEMIEWKRTSEMMDELMS